MFQSWEVFRGRRLLISPRIHVMLSPFFCVSTDWKWPRQPGIGNSFWEELRKRRDSFSRGKWILKQITTTWSKGQCGSHPWVWNRRILSICITALICDSSITLSFHLWNECEIPLLCQEKELKCWGAEISPDQNLVLGARSRDCRSPDGSHEFQKDPVKTQIWIWQAGDKGTLPLGSARKESSFREGKSTPSP